MIGTRQPFGHLTAGRVAGTEKEDPKFLHSPDRIRGWSPRTPAVARRPLAEDRVANRRDGLSLEAFPSDNGSD